MAAARRQETAAARGSADLLVFQSRRKHGRFEVDTCCVLSKWPRRVQSSRGTDASRGGIRLEVLDAHLHLHPLRWKRESGFAVGRCAGAGLWIVGDAVALGGDADEVAV